MPRPSQDTVPVCVRMPRGAAERLKTLTGVPFSTLCRIVLMKQLTRLEAAKANQLQDVATQIEDIVKEVGDGSTTA